MRHILLFIFFIFLQGCANPTKDSFIYRGNIDKDTILSEEYMFGQLAQVENYGFNLVYCRNDKESFCSYLNMPINPIFDNFERALEDPSNDTKSLKEGLDMILKQFSSFLEKEKVAPIKAIGEKFDPAIHEALTSEESGEHEENIIISQFVKGYMINNRVLRPSQVVISKKPPIEPEKNSDKEKDPTD